MAENDNEPANTAAAEQHEQRWGRVLICGGTDWRNLGRKDRKGGALIDDEEHPDLLEPHILRSLANVKITGVYASCAGCHCIALDADGNAWMFGRNEQRGLGVPEEVVSEHHPIMLSAPELGAPKGTTFVHAACGRGHSLLVGSNGEVWTAGTNNFGQCGQPVSPNVPTFTLMKAQLVGGKENITKVGAGISFSILLTQSGKLYGLGSGEHGQLGNGRTGEHISTGNKTQFDVHSEPVLVKGLQDVVITDIACGAQHCIAIDATGLVYVWGNNGYCRLGLGNQQPVLMPKVVPHFAGSNDLTKGRQVVAGPTNSVVIDRQGMYWMAGKWKNSGEGSAGSPYSTFRYMQDIMGCKMYHASCGGVTHWALAPDDDGSVMTIAWGQNAANGELGHGPDEPKSATKPKRHEPLIGIDVFSVTAAQNTTFILARPNEKFSDLPRYPLQVDAPEVCVKCDKDTGDDDSPLECDKCDTPYHLGCLSPPLSAVPDGEWFCPKCALPPVVASAKKGAGAQKRKDAPAPVQSGSTSAKRKK